MPAEPFPGPGQRGEDAPRPGDPGRQPAGDGPGLGGDDGLPEWAFPDDRPPGGGDWWPAEDFEEPWPDYAVMTPVDAGPAAGLDPGLDAGFVSRDRVAGQQGRAGSGFSSGHAFDTSVPGPALAQALDAACTSTGGYPGLDDDELIGVLAGWARTEAWAAAGRLAAVAELAARRPPARRKDAATRGGKPAGWSRFCADEVAVALSLSRRAAERMVPLAHELATRLPLTRQALADGIISDYKAQLIAEATRVLGEKAAADAEAAVVPGDVTGKTPGQIRAAIGRAVIKADPECVRYFVRGGFSLSGSGCLSVTVFSRYLMPCCPVYSAVPRNRTFRAVPGLMLRVPVFPGVLYCCGRLLPDPPGIAWRAVPVCH